MEEVDFLRRSTGILGKRTVRSKVRVTEENVVPGGEPYKGLPVCARPSDTSSSVGLSSDLR